MNGQDKVRSNDDADGSAIEARPPSAARDAGLTTGPSVPDYELIRRIGRGAYGEVWLARSKATGVLRAAKIVWRHTFEDGHPFEREFEGIQKFEHISREHSSQLALFHIGRNEAAGYFYYVMELADALQDPQTPSRGTEQIGGPTGEGAAPDRGVLDEERYAPHTLRAELGQGRLQAVRVLEVGLALTEALHHLHRNGLVHRDVKPSNVIFVNGRPKLADIGLVTDASDQCSIVGTEGYLPPEGPGTPQADIFSLGKVLYEAATGQDRRAFPNLPPELRDWPDATAVGELNEIVVKACAKEPAGRYSSCEEMHDELALLGEGKSVRRSRQAERRWLLVWRSAGALAAIAAVFTLMTLAVRAWRPPAGRHERRSRNPEANRLYDLGKANFDMFRGTNMAVAADYFEKAVLADTNFAQAYGFLAATYFWGGFNDWNPGWIFLPRAKEAAVRALELDDKLAEPRLALGWYHAMREWKWSEAEKEERRAVEVNESSWFCHLCYAELLRMMGRTKDALKEIYKARDLNPSSRVINARLEHYLTDARLFEEALAQIRVGLAMETLTDEDAAWSRRDIFLALHRIDDSLEAERTIRIAGGESRDSVDRDIADLKGAVAAEGIKALWRPRLKYLQQHGDLYDQARCYAQLGETNSTLTCLEKLLKEHDAGLTFNIMRDWMLDPIRSEPRFHVILQAMHFE